MRGASPLSFGSRISRSLTVIGFVYKLDAGSDSYIGYVRLHVKRPARRKYSVVDDMVGDWVALGAERKRGRISFKRVA